MNTLCVTGYASLDYVMNLENGILPDQTTLGQRFSNAWPRVGGCPAYIAMAADQAKCAAVPIAWVGDDAHGQKFLSRLKQRDIDIKGVAVMPGMASPTALMLYQPDGNCACIYDPAMAGQERLSTQQRTIIAEATHLCISVGPPHLMAEILELQRSDARLYWAVKKDANCFTPDICTHLSARADVIFCSASERDMIGDTNAVVIQTLGSKGVVIETGDSSVTVSVDPIEVRDTTGAGDSFAGGYIAAEMHGITQPRAAVEHAIAAVQQVLRDRQKGDTS